VYPHVKQFEVVTQEHERDVQLRRELRLARAVSMRSERKLHRVVARLRLQPQT
jgi:hypothetical protein